MSTQQLRPLEYLLFGLFGVICYLLLTGNPLVEASSKLETYPNLTDTSDTSQFLKCAESYCLAKNYSKLEVGRIRFSSF